MTKKLLAKYHQIDKCDVFNSIYKSYYKRTRARNTRKLPYIFASLNGNLQRAKSIAV